MSATFSAFRSHALRLVLPGAWLISLAAPGSAYTTYTDRASWEAALSGRTIVTDTFSTTINSAQTISLDSGIVSTNSGPAVLPNPPYDNNSVGVITSGAYDNAVQAGSGTASNTISWVFPTAVTAFGADFINASTNRLSLNGDFDGSGLQSLIVHTTIGGSNGFLGVIGTTSFTSIILVNPLTQIDSFSIDNASFVPVPGPLPLLGASLAYGWSRRLRQRMGVHSRHRSQLG
jgi:hypothetical protein